MTSKDREYGGAFIHWGSAERRQPRAEMHVCVVRHTLSRVRRSLIRAGHAFYVIAVDNLFVRGSPFRLNYSQSSAGLP
jgi:hypothetical protein